MIVVLILLSAAFHSIATAARPMTTTAAIAHIESDFPIAELDDSRWKLARDVGVGDYWSGEKAPDSRGMRARLLWSFNSLYVRFEAVQCEPLIISEKPRIDTKTIGLWGRDVCEIFIAPDRNKRNKYFEFEIAPTGEWIDLGIEVTPKKRLTDWEYRSDMTSAVRVEKDKVVMAIKIPFASLGKTPKEGDVWLGNLFRCVGSGPNRGYLAWRPTNIKNPAFHVPEAFGEFIFADR